MEKQIAAGGIVIRKEQDDLKVLLIKDSYGRWTWPKGHIEKGETPMEAAVREVTEETGLNELNVIEQVGVQEYYFTFKGEKTFKQVYIFLMQNTAKEKLIPQTEEIELAEWFPEKQAIETIEYEGSPEMVERAIYIFKKRANK